MTEVAIREEPGEVEPETGLIAWAREARAAASIAESLARTSFVPRAMQGKPAEVTAAILTGREIGIEPMSALRSIDVIEGTPAMRAHALRGLVQAHGHAIWVEESTQTRAIVAGRRKGEEQVQKSTWTTARAERMGLIGKQNWKRMPEAMLIARATAEVCRLVAADVLLGIPYAVEELDDDRTEAPAPRRRTVQRAPVPPPAEPELEAPEPVVGVVEPTLDEDWPEPARPADADAAE